MLEMAAYCSIILQSLTVEVPQQQQQHKKKGSSIIWSRSVIQATCLRWCNLHRTLSQ